jgi:hypothetical protein
MQIILTLSKKYGVPLSKFKVLGGVLWHWDCSIYRKGRNMHKLLLLVLISAFNVMADEAPDFTSSCKSHNRKFQSMLMQSYRVNDCNNKAQSLYYALFYNDIKNTKQNVTTIMTSCKDAVPAASSNSYDVDYYIGCIDLARDLVYDKLSPEEINAKISSCAKQSDCVHCNTDTQLLTKKYKLLRCLNDEI